jgi:hypothetical protein
MNLKFEVSLRLLLVVIFVINATSLQIDETSLTNVLKLSKIGWQDSQASIKTEVESKPESTLKRLQINDPYLNVNQLKPSQSALQMKKKKAMYNRGVYQLKSIYNELSNGHLPNDDERVNTIRYIPSLKSKLKTLKIIK